MCFVTKFVLVFEAALVVTVEVSSAGVAPMFALFPSLQRFLIVCFSLFLGVAQDN